MERLTKKLLNGNWNVNGCPWDKIHGEIYGALCKLKDYEDTGLTPQEIADGKLLTGWIPVGERLPADEVDVLITTGEEKVDVDFVIDGVWFFGNNDYDVIAWMPLPEAYKGA